MPLGGTGIPPHKLQICGTYVVLSHTIPLPKARRVMTWTDELLRHEHRWVFGVLFDQDVLGVDTDPRTRVMAQAYERLLGHEIARRLAHRPVLDCVCEVCWTPV